MKNLTIWIKQLVVLCALLVTSVANAGLIESKVTDNSWSTTEPFDSKDYYSITNLGDVYKNTYGEMLWDIDIMHLSSLSFKMVFATSDESASSFSLLLVGSNTELTLQSYTTNVGEIGSQQPSVWYQETIALTSHDLSFFNTDEQVKLAFRHTALLDIPRSSRAQAIFKDINFSLVQNNSTAVPEPASIGLLLLALVLISSRKWAKSPL